MRDVLIFLLASVIVTGVAVWPVLRWLIRRGEPVTEQDGSATEDTIDAIARARLLEVESDFKSGLVDEETAAELRKLIVREHHSSTRTASSASKPMRLRWFAAAALVVCIPLGSLLAYGRLFGAPGMGDLPLAARLSQDPATMRADELIVLVERRVYDNPRDAVGWQHLASIYMRLGRVDDAVHAYRNIIRLLGSNAERQADLGVALVRRADGVVSEQAQEAFKAAQAHDESDWRPRYFLALGLMQAGEYVSAVSAWKALIAEGERIGKATGEAPEWLRAARQQLHISEQRAVADERPSRPRLDVSDAQMAQIEAMVAGLDARLARNGDDLSGWLRLIRSYAVLGQQDRANQAALKARAQFHDDSRALGEIAALIDMLELAK